MDIMQLQFISVIAFFILSQQCLAIDTATCKEFTNSTVVKLVYATKFSLKKFQEKKSNTQIIWLKSYEEKDNNWVGVTDSKNIKNLRASCPEFKIIEEPKRIVASSTTHLQAFLDLLSEDKLYAFTQTQMITGKIWKEREAQKKLVNFPLNPNVENFLQHHVDLYLTYTAIGGDQHLGSQSGIFSFLNFPILEFREDHPLGRAEWIKVFGVFLGKFDLAEKVFSKRVYEYKNILKKVSKGKNHKVLLGEFLGEKWVFPAPNSDLIQLLTDAKLEIIRPKIKKDSIGPEFYQFEEIFPLIKEAEFWFIQSNVTSKELLLKKDVRYTSFLKPRIITIGQTQNKNGYSDYWETGVSRPDLLLKDFLSIIYPETFANHKLLWLNEIK